MSTLVIGNVPSPCAAGVTDGESTCDDEMDREQELHGGGIRVGGDAHHDRARQARDGWNAAGAGDVR